MAKLTAGQVYQYAIGAGFSPLEAEQAVVISYMESGWNTTASNSSAAGGKWGPAVGLMQVRSLVSPPASGTDSMRNAGQLTDPAYNMKAAYAIFTDDGGWSTGGWSTFSHVQANDTTYQAALAAAKSSTASSPTTAQNALSWSDINPYTWVKKGGQATAEAVTGGAAAFTAALPAIADFDTIMKHLIDPKFWVRVGYVWVATTIMFIGLMFILFSNKSASHGVKRGATYGVNAAKTAHAANKAAAAKAVKGAAETAAKAAAVAA